MNRKGKLYFRYGTMGSAKTALLLTQAYNFEERGMRYHSWTPAKVPTSLNPVLALSANAGGYTLTLIYMNLLSSFLKKT